MTEWIEKILPGLSIEHIAFSTDNKLLASTSKCNVFVYTIKDLNKPPITGECSSNIVSVFFNSSNELVTVTTGGELSTWEILADEISAKNIRRVTAFPVRTIVWSHSKKTSIWITDNNAINGKLVLNVLMNDQTLQKICDIDSTIGDDQIAVTEKHVVYCLNKDVIKIKLEPEEDEESTEIFTYSSNLQGLTFDENEKNNFERVAAHGDIIVASLSIGKVYVWNHQNTKKITLSSAFTLHWHKVSAPMVVTAYGGLVSAGAETVLCKWSTKNAGKPTMLSRLQAAVVKIILSEDCTHVALLMEDNSVHVVLLSAMSILSSIPTITYCERSLQNVFKSDDRVPGTIVLNGTPGSIQWLCLSTSKNLQQASISLENAVEGDMSNVRFAQTYHRLENVVLSQNYIASLEHLVNFDQNTKRLRFWKRISDFEIDLVDTLSVPIDTEFLSTHAHTNANDENLFVVCRSAGVIDVWYKNEDNHHWLKDVGRSLTTWQESSIIATSSIVRHNIWASAHRNTIKACVVIWDLYTMTTLEVVDVKGDIRLVEWASDELLIISTTEAVMCWSSKTLSTKWSVEQSLKCHISFRGCFGWENDHVIEFDHLTGSLISSRRFSSNIHELVAVGKDCIDLVAKTDKGLTVLRKRNIQESLTMECDISHSVNETPFSRLSSISAVNMTVSNTRNRMPNTQNIMKIFDAPCHALPPLSHLAPLFISSCLAPPIEL